MRPEGQVRQQLKQIIYRHRQHLLRCNFKHQPDSCIHSKKAALGQEQVGMCSLRVCVICDQRMGNCLELAKACPLWEPRKTKKEIKEDFDRLVTSTDRGQIAALFPDIAALMWVLDTDFSAQGKLDLIEFLTASEDEEGVPA